jgi:hypothetical protein
MTLTPDHSNEGDGLGEAVAMLASLRQLAEAPVSGVMLIAGRKDEEPEVSQLEPTQRALPVLNEVVRTAIAAFTNSEVIDYGPATTTSDGQIMWITTDSVPLLRAIADESADLAGVPSFDPSRTKLSRLQLAAMRVVDDTASAVFIQALRGNQIVAQSRRIGVMIRRGVIDLPPRGQMVLLNRGVAAVVMGDVAFFKDRAAFQRLFGYLEELRELADATFRSVTADLRILGLDQMAAAVSGSPAMLGKMASIQRKLDQYPQYRAALTMSNLLEFIRRHPECSVEVSGEDADTQLVYQNDPQHRFKILNVLDDDFLRSELTNLEYQANSKSAPIT